MVANRTFLSLNHALIRAYGLRSRIDHSHVSITVIHSPIVHKMFNRWLYHLNVLAEVQRNCHFRVNFQYKSKISKVILSQVKVIKVQKTYGFLFMQRYLHATCLKVVYKGTESVKMILNTIAAGAKRSQIDIYKYRTHLRHSKDIRATDNRKSVPRTGIGGSINIFMQI